MNPVVRVTVCELRSGGEHFAADWAALAAHVRAEGSDLVLLPEMGLAPWFARTRPFDAAAWRAAVDAHAAWLPRLAELAPAVVLGTRPVNTSGGRRNEAFAWDTASGYRAAHTKYYLPDEADFWEASWYARGDGRFDAIDTPAGRVGFMVCTEMWFYQHARAYGQAGAQIIATPRCTPRETLDKWLAGGRASAVVAGTYSLSSNHGDERFGGLGWVIDPDGNVLATTSRERPWVTVALDLAAAAAAQHTYPRYVTDGGEDS